MEVQYIAKWFKRSAYCVVNRDIDRLEWLFFVAAALSFTLIVVFLHTPSVGTSFLYEHRWGTALFLLTYSRSLCHLSYFPSYLFVLLGEPSRFPGDGNHSPDLGGHLWTHLCNGWEPRISHKGWSALPHSSVAVASAESYAVRKIKVLRRWWRRWDGPNIRLSFFFWSIKVPKFPSRSHSWGCWEQQQQQRWSRSCI